MANGNWRADMKKADVDLVLDAAKAYGLKDDQVFAAAVREGVVTIVTIGGHKCRWSAGAKVEVLHPLQKGESILPLAPPAPPKAK